MNPIRNVLALEDWDNLCATCARAVGGKPGMPTMPVWPGKCGLCAESRLCSKVEHYAWPASVIRPEPATEAR